MLFRRPRNSNANNNPVPVSLQELIQHYPDLDGAVYVSPRSLIKLRHAAENMPLKVTKLRALQTGHYYSPFKGRGMEFDEVRPYLPGDDVRTLDWRVTARTGKAHTKLFREERERSVLLWVDFRSSMRFATRGVFKSVVAAQTAALLAWSALQHGDRLGGLLFSEQFHRELRPKNGKAAVLHFIQQLADHSANQLHNNRHVNDEERQREALLTALSRLRRVSRPGSLLILVSDFRQFDQQAESHLLQLARHNDVVMIFVYDPIESELPPAGVYRLSNTQQTFSIDTAREDIRKHYNAQFLQRVTYIQELAKRHHVYFMRCATTDDVVPSIQRGFGLRQ